MKTDLIINYLDELFPNPKCELNYNKDYELLIAVMLSAQTTDKRVNSVTSILFNKYDNLEKLKEATVDDISDIIDKGVDTAADLYKEGKDVVTDQIDKFTN